MFSCFRKIYPKSESDKLPERGVEQNYYHKLTLNELQTAFRTDLVNGLNSKMAKLLQDELGKNVINTSDSAIVLKMFQNFFGGFMALLWGAFILSKRIGQFCSIFLLTTRNFHA